MKRLRVITYRQQNLVEFIIEISQDLLTASLNILIVELNIDMDVKFIYIFNLYNAPAGCAGVEKLVMSIFGADTLT